MGQGLTELDLETACRVHSVESGVEGKSLLSWKVKSFFADIASWLVGGS